MAENGAGHGTHQLSNEDEGGLDRNVLQKDEASIDESELRTDPEDDKTYTWPEFKAAKLELFTLEELIEYWFDEMTPDLPEGTKVVVSGLGKAADDEVLARAFSAVGELAFCQVYYDANEESKGFAKLQFTTVEAAEAAVKQMDGTELGGQSLVVRPLMDKGQNTAVFVGGLDPETTEVILEKVFSDVGEVAEVSISSDRETGESRGTAKIEFIFPHSVDQACRRFHLATLGGKRVCCRPWLERAIKWSGRRVRVQGPSVLVARMSVETTAESLRQLFESIEGMVVCNVRIIIDRDTGRPRGLAHVEIGDKALIDVVVSKLNGTELDGSSIIVQSFDNDGKPPRLPAVMCRQLTDDTTAAQLKEHFAEFGCNGAKIILNRENGKPYGCGVVEFHDEDSAIRAAEELNGSQLNGASIRLGHGSKRLLGPTVFVTGISHDVDEEAFAEFFAEAGEVLHVSIFRDRETGTPMGKALVVFKSQDAKLKALNEFNGRELHGKPIEVREGVNRGEHFAVFVAGLHSGTTAQDLARHFAHCGEVVEANVVTNKETGESRCFGRVSFRSEELQRKAIQECNGSELDGRIIVVREHEPGYKTNRHPQLEHAVFLAGLNFETTAHTLQAFFADCGPVSHVHIYSDRETRRSRGIAKVSFPSEAAAQRAMEKADGAQVDGAIITAREFERSAVGNGSWPSVFVGALFPGTTVESLRRHFASAGPVMQAFVLYDRASGKCKGAARVSFATEEAQRMAIEKLHLSELDGRTISVHAYERPNRAGTTSNADGSHRRGDAGMAPALEGGHAAFVVGLHHATRAQGLEAHFSVFGRVYDAVVLTDKESGLSRCMGRVRFTNEEDLQKAIEEGDGSVLDGRQITVKQWVSSSAKEGHEDDGAMCQEAAAQPDPRELRLDPEDGMAYTFTELEQRHGKRWSTAELRDYWRFDCSPAPVGAPRGAAEDEAGGSDDDDGAASEPPALVPAGAAAPGLGAAAAAEAAQAEVEAVPSTAYNAKNMALGMQEWLSAVDKLWLQRMDGIAQVPADRGARSCLKLLTEKFESLGQIMSIYAERLPSGKLSLKDAFFDNTGITKLGHKRLMKKWISENT